MGKKIESLVINITDACDMECVHCLRGDRGSRRLDLGLIPRIFEGIDRIESMTISGGEPGLYTEAVTHIVDYLVGHRDEIQVDGFCIVTNGKEYRQELVDGVRRMMLTAVGRGWEGARIDGSDRMHRYVMDEVAVMFQLMVSLDAFHEPIDAMNYIKYASSGVYSPAKEEGTSKKFVLSRGRGNGVMGSVYRALREFDVYEDDDGLVAGEVYVTVEGKVFGDCDMSYEMEEYNEPAGDLEDETLARIMQRCYDEQQKDEEEEDGQS